MTFLWDHRKNERNLAIHGILTPERVDDRFDYAEIRIYAIGVSNGLEITLIYTDVSETERRIISAWKAERYEKNAYWKSLK